MTPRGQLGTDHVTRNVTAVDDLIFEINRECDASSICGDKSTELVSKRELCPPTVFTTALTKEKVLSPRQRRGEHTEPAHSPIHELYKRDQKAGLRKVLKVVFLKA